MADLSLITSFPEKGHLHRDVDRIILDGVSRGIKAAIVCPPCIYGRGTGPGKTLSAQIPWLAEAVLKLKHGFVVGEGAAEWSCVHVLDLAEVYVKLVEAAARGGEGAEWFEGEGEGKEEGSGGYYFAENGRFRWREVTDKILDVARKKGLLNDEQAGKVVNMSAQEVAEKAHPFGGVLWGTNSLCSADRARRALGWEPKEVGWEETVEEEIEEAARAVGLV